MKTHYETLGISPTANSNQIKKSFKNLALQYHPDKNPSKKTEQTFKTINEAYQILSNPTKRHYYDQTLQTESQSQDHTSKTTTFKSYAYKPSIADWKIGAIFFTIFLLLLAAMPFFSYFEIQRDFQALENFIYDGDYNRATKLIVQVYDKGGDPSRIYYYQALLKLEENEDYKTALWYINKALSLEPDNIQYIMLLAKIYIELPTYIYDIPDILGPILSQAKDHPEANFYLGQYYLHKQNYSQAIACFQLALDDEHLVFKTQIYYAITLQKQGAYQEAIEILETLENNVRGRAKPIDLVNLFYYIGQHYFIQQDTLKACNYWKTAQNIIYVKNVDSQIKAFCIR